MKKLTVSGAYITYGGKFVDYEVEMVIPNCPEEYYITNAERYLPILLKESDKYKEAVQNIAKIYIDDVEDVADNYSIQGVDIKEMNMKQIQELACYSLVRSIPLPYTGSIREVRETTYREYSKNYLNKNVDDVEYNELPPLVIKINGCKAVATQEVVQPAAPEVAATVAPAEAIEVPENETETNAEEPTEEQTLSMDDLKAIADSKGIKYAAGIGYKTLYSRVFAEN